jgi:EAL domain-containing protein (putative c-di-GMP-specific phosphodiesterase class I)
MKLGVVGKLIGILATGLTAVALLVAMYVTEFDTRWVTFLAGVAVAAVLASVSAASTAQWRLLRRTQELKRARERLREEAARHQRAMAAFRSAEARLRLLGGALAWPVFLLDRDEICRYHNAAAAAASALPAERIDGAPLRAVLGEAGYEGAKARLAAAPASEAGICLVLDPDAVEAAAPTPEATHEQQVLVPGDRGELLYMRAITNELTGWDDPQARLVEALNEDRFLLFGQRIVPVAGDAADPLCLEVLLRLQEEEDNFLPPGGFLPVAERYGMLEDLDRWVVRRLIGHCLERRRAEPEWSPPLYCVNLSTPAIRSEPFARFVREELSQSGFDPRALCFEIPEVEVAGARDAVRRLIADLKPLGCRFTVDAFGAVGASFGHLQGLAFDFVKIDGVVVQNVLRDPGAAARLKAINSVCHRLGLRTIAEFVEDEATLAAVRRAGVDYVQGFGIARPEPLERAEAAAAPGGHENRIVAPDGAQTAVG